MISSHNKNTIKIRGQLVDVSKKLVMGILNLTPDSFFDGGKLSDPGAVLVKAGKMLDEGARILDIGGYSSRPGATVIPAEEEINRIIKPIQCIRKNFPDSIISVDTFRSEVAARAIDAGADLVNDISAGTMDSKMPGTIARLQVPYIIMHMQGRPENMQCNPVYEHVIQDVLSFFSNRITFLQSLGIPDLIVDPGFGFGKTMSHNYELLGSLEMFKIFNLPLLVGLSRKSMIYKALDTDAEAALNGSSVLQTIALMKGANILRVHDVKEAIEAIKLVDLYQNPNQVI